MPEHINPTVLVIFGGTGDLSRKKLIPSLMDLASNDHLPKTFRIVGFSRRELAHDDYRDFVREVIDKKDHQHGVEAMEQFLSRVSYIQGNFGDLQSYRKLAKYLSQIDEEIGQCTNKLLYLAVPPNFYETIFENLRASELSLPCSDEAGWTRVLVEKPFGKDLHTAQELDKKLCSVFKEEQIFRIDHYLAKDAVQNILAFRFTNVLLENSWNSAHIEHVRIRLSEEFGVEQRAQFYDGIGALRDVGQNHILQMLALIAMDNPGVFRAEALREQRATVLRALRPYADEHTLSEHVVRAQYEGYRDIETVEEESSTETYFLLKTFVDNDRWRNVPFYLESGKKLNETRTDIVVTFRPQLPCVCGEEESHGHQNVLTISIKPKHEIRLRLWVKKSGLNYELEPRDLVLECGGQKHVDATDAYEKVLYDCILGDQTLFTSGDEVRAAWAFITPILKCWDTIPLRTYAQGTAGPENTLQKHITN